jgi:hypothetical protein
MQRSPSPTIPKGLTFGSIARSETADADEDTSSGLELRVEEGFSALSEAGFIYSVKGRTAIGTAGGGFAVLNP